MRTDQLQIAIAQKNNRFEVCQIVSKGLRLTHKQGTRMQDSIGDMLDTLNPLFVSPHKSAVLGIKR